MRGKKVKDPRRVNDFWTRKAKAEKYPARSVFKLEEADRKYGIFKSGGRVLDLGCHPGSWSLYAGKKVGSSGLVVGIDLQATEVDHPVWVRFMQMDVTHLTNRDLEDAAPFDVVLSDMAPATTGNKSVDQDRSFTLFQTALYLAESLLAQGGKIYFKVFQGPDVDGLIKEMGDRFASVRRIKPKSSRSFSPEIFVLGTGFKTNHFRGG